MDTTNGQINANQHIAATDNLKIPDITLFMMAELKGHYEDVSRHSGALFANIFIGGIGT